jgi:hypothetical protein
MIARAVDARRFRLRPWHVVLGACLVYLLIVFAAYRNPLEFVWPGSRFDPTIYSRDVEGYDGQFAYYIARDLGGAAKYLDVPAYRYQRIVYPLLAWALSLGGQPALLPWVMVIINLIALSAGTALLERLLVQEKVSRWYALSYGLFAGVFVAVRFSTNEPLAYGLVLGALVAARRGSIRAFAALLAVAILTKETTLFFGIGYGLYFIFQRRWLAALLLGIATSLPFLIWQVALNGAFGTFGVGSGGAMATPFEVLPFNGIWRAAAYGPQVFIVTALVAVPGALIPTLWALWRTGRDVIANRHDAYTFLLLANAIIMPFVPFSTYREPFGILRFMPGLVIGVLLYAARRRVWRALRYSLLWVVLGVRVLG